MFFACSLSNKSLKSAAAPKAKAAPHAPKAKAAAKAPQAKHSAAAAAAKRGMLRSLSSQLRMLQAAAATANASGLQRQ